MNQNHLSRAKEFVSNTDLADVPTYSDDHLAPPPPRFLPLTDEDQAAIVGSQIQTFLKGVDATKRNKVLRAMLFGQLAADKAVKKAKDDNTEWYRAYFEALANVGFVVGQLKEQALSNKAIQADVEKAVLELAASLLVGPAVSAYKIVEAALRALQMLEMDSPAVTIFSRQTQRQNARFQIAAIEQLQDDISVLVLVFSLQASAEVTQVLFFKTKLETAQMTHQSAQLTLLEDAFEGVSDLINQKVAKHMEGYVRQLEI